MTSTSSPFGRVWSLAALLLVAVSGSVGQGLHGLDIQIFRSINNQQNPRHDGFFEYLDYTSIPTFGAIPVGFVVSGSVADNQSVVETGLLSGLAQGAGLGVTLILKELVGRPRPFSALSSVKVKHQWSAGGASFPSGHTSQAFSIATVFSLRYRKAGITVPFFLWAAAVGYSRIFLGVHYPSDVLGGAVIGVASGFAAWSVRGNVHNTVRRTFGEQSVVLLPVPRTELVRFQLPL